MTNTQNRSRFLPWLAVLSLASALLGGCAGVPRPTPANNLPVATTQVAGVVVSVPRLDHGDYPGDILDIAAAVLVLVENRSNVEVLIDPENFTLTTPDGNHYSPLPPQQLALRQLPKVPDSPKDSEMLAMGFRGGGGGVRVAPPASSFGGMRSAPAYRGGSSWGGGRPGGGVYRPGWGGGGYRGGWGGYRSGGWYGYRGYGGYGGYGMWPWWSNPLWWGPGSAYGFYDGSTWMYGPRSYAWSREDAIRFSLPAGKLAPGARTAGFVYFPRVNNPEGSQIVLSWQLRESVNHAVIGNVQLPLEWNAE